MNTRSVSLVRPAPDANGEWIDYGKALMRVAAADGVVCWARIVNAERMPVDPDITGAALFLDAPVTVSELPKDRPAGRLVVWEMRRGDPAVTVDPARLSARTPNMGGAISRGAPGRGGGESVAIYGGNTPDAPQLRLNSEGAIISTARTTLAVDGGGKTVIAGGSLEMPDAPQMGPVTTMQNYIIDFIPKTIVTPFPARLPLVGKILALADGIRAFFTALNGSLVGDESKLAAAIDRIRSLR